MAKKSTGSKTRRRSTRKKEAWTPENMAKRTGAFLRATSLEAAQEFGNEAIAAAGDAGRLIIGVPLPSFSLEYLLQNTVFPLGRVAQIVGEEGTCKSGFCFEVTRWFRRYCNGVAALLENESKYSPDWAMSIIGWDEPYALSHDPCNSMDQWQQHLQWWTKRAKDAMKGDSKNPGSGRTWPFLLIVDSIMGKAMAETSQRIERDGFAGRNHPAEALSLTSFLRKIPQDLQEWPFSLLAVNHLKPHKDPYTQARVRNKAGGRGLSFQETFELELSRQAKPHIKLVGSGVDGLRLQIRCFKNSLGVTDRRLNVNVLWWDEEQYDATTDSYEWRQKTVWDWHGATTELLLGQEGTAKKRVEEVLDLRKKVNTKKVYSDRLGISPENAVEYHDAGRMICEDPDVLQGLRKIFGIKERKTFRNDIDYLEQQRQEKRRVAQELEEG